MTVYAIIVTGLLLVAGAYIWVQRNEIATCYQDGRDLLEINDRVEKELKFTKDSIVALYNRPIYVSMTEEQIEKIAVLIGERVKAPKWLN